MDVPKIALELIAKIESLYRDDIGKAIEKCKEEVRKDPAFPAWKEILIDMAIQELVYDARHAATTKAKNQNKEYGKAVPVRDNEAVAKAYDEVEEIYSMRLCGKTLGSMTGEDLDWMVEKERGLANGHIFNVVLGKTLRPLVSQGKTVREAVGRKKMMTIWEKVHRQLKLEEVA